MILSVFEIEYTTETAVDAPCTAHSTRNLSSKASRAFCTDSFHKAIFIAYHTGTGNDDHMLRTAREAAHDSPSLHADVGSNLETSGTGRVSH